MQQWLAMLRRPQNPLHLIDATRRYLFGVQEITLEDIHLFLRQSDPIEYTECLNLS